MEAVLEIQSGILSETRSGIQPEKQPAIQPNDPSKDQPGHPRYQILNANALKIIALVTMLIDHIGAAVIEPGRIFPYENGVPGISYETALWWWNIDLPIRMIGRLAFPIYCFLLVEGFVHTSSVKKYGLRLLVFGLISEIPFDLAFRQSWCDPTDQNVFFTLFLGLIALWFLRRYEGCFWKQAAAFLACSFGAWALKTDYDAYGVFLIVLLYLIRRLPKVPRTIVGALGMTYEITIAFEYLTEVLAIIPIALYNGEKGRRWNKYLFYAFYPAHILVLYFIRGALFG